MNVLVDTHSACSKARRQMWCSTGHLVCRYIAFFSLRGIAEWALASGKLFAEGVRPKEAAGQDGAMVEQLGMLRGMDKPAAWTSGLNWYRYNFGSCCKEDQRNVTTLQHTQQGRLPNRQALHTVHMRWGFSLLAHAVRHCLCCAAAYLIWLFNKYHST